jgi:recombination DNA repair RAD52 pathway protein
MTTLHKEQVDVLLRPINGNRVLTLDGLSHLAAWDVRAHLIRIFGFGGWSADLTNLDLIYDVETTTRAGKPARKVAYRATVKLTIHATLATYTEAAVGESVMPDFKHGDCHDMAIKTAESQALNRCAVNLGDQFGMSLYAKGSRNAVVKGSVAYTGEIDEPDEQVTPDPEQVPTEE